MSASAARQHHCLVEGRGRVHPGPNCAAGSSSSLHACSHTMPSLPTVPQLVGQLHWPPIMPR